MFDQWVSFCGRYAIANEGIEFDVQLGDMVAEVVYVCHRNNEVLMAIQHSFSLVECLSFDQDGVHICRVLKEYPIMAGYQYFDGLVD